jgi:hypothetical protein
MARVDAYWQDKLNRQTAASWAIANAIRQQSQVQMQQSQQNTQQFIQNLQAQDAHRRNSTLRWTGAAHARGMFATTSSINSIT